MFVKLRWGLLLAVFLTVPGVMVLAGPFDDTERPVGISFTEPVTVITPGQTGEKPAGQSFLPETPSKSLESVIREASALPPDQRGPFLLAKAWELAKTPEDFLALAASVGTGPYRTAILEVGAAKGKDLPGFVKVVQEIGEPLSDRFRTDKANTEKALKDFLSADSKQRTKRIVDKGIALAQEAKGDPARINALQEVYKAVTKGNWCKARSSDQILTEASRLCTTIDQFKGLMALDPGDHVLSVIYDQWSNFERQETAAVQDEEDGSTLSTLTILPPEFEEPGQERPTIDTAMKIGMASGMGPAVVALAFGR